MANNILVERVDQRLDLPGRVMRSQMIRGDETERQRMCAYLSAACAGGGAVRVEYAQKGGYGRCYPVAARKKGGSMVRGATCYTKMRGPVRAALAGLLYHDLDLVNAQPVLALQLAARAGVPREQLPHLARLVERREECLAEVMRACGVARAAAKNLYVREMFKGSCDRWAADNGVARAAVPQFARDLQADVDLAARAVVAADARAREWQRRHKPDAPRPLATAFALACQQAEHECLLAMHGAALGAGRRVGAWIYDGLLVERRPGAAGAGPAGDALLRLMEARVRERTGMEVRVAEKPMHVWEIYCEPPARGMPAPERPGPEVERALRRELQQQKLDAGSLAYDEDHNVLFTVGGGAEAGEMRTAQLGMLVVGGAVVRGPLRAAEPFFVGRLELPRAHQAKVGADRWAARWGAVATGEMMVVVDGGGAREFMLELTNSSAPRGMIRMAVRCSSRGDDGADQQVVVLGDADLTQLDFPRRAVLRLDAAARDKVFAETCNGWVQDVLRRVMRVEDAIVARVADRVAERVGAAVAEQMALAAAVTNKGERLLDLVLAAAAARGLARLGKDVMRPDPARPTLFLPECSVRRFVRAVGSEDAALARANCRVYDDVNASLAKDDFPELPTLVRDPGLLAFDNGLVLLAGAAGTFVPFEDAEAVRAALAERAAAAPPLHACEARVPRHHVRGVDWTPSRATPLVDGILAHQRFEPETVAVLFALLGRTLFRVNEMDALQVVPLLVGIGATGKSTLLDTLARLFAPDAVGSVNAALERVFGLASMLDKEVVVAPDIPRDLFAFLDLSIFKSMVTGESVLVPRKNAAALTQRWAAPLVLAGNFMPLLRDGDGGGAVARRLVVFPFDHVVAEPDPTLAQRIAAAELPAFLNRALDEYRDRILRGTGGGLLRLPQQLQTAREDKMRSVDVFARFLGARTESAGRVFYVLREEGARTHLADLKRGFLNFMRVHEADTAVPKWDESLYVPQLQRMGCTIAKVKVCKACLAPPPCVCPGASHTNRTTRVMVTGLRMVAQLSCCDE